MAEHLWSVLCSKILVDPDSQMRSLIDVAESVYIAGLDQLVQDALSEGQKGAYVHARVKLVSWWYRSDMSERTLQARIVIVSPAGERLLAQLATVQWGENILFSRIDLDFENLPATMAGLYWFVVEQQTVSEGEESRWAVMTRLPLFILDKRLLSDDSTEFEPPSVPTPAAPPESSSQT